MEPPPALEGRPVTEADVPDLTALENRAQPTFFGAVESDAAELLERLGHVADLRTGSRVVVTGGGVPVAFGCVRLAGEASLHLDPAAAPADRAAALADLVAWLPGAGAEEVEVLSRDDEQLVALRGAGWAPWFSSFELARAVAAADPLPEPRWPAGLTVTGLDLDRDGPAVHAMVYERSGWAEVRGHRVRPWEQWRSLFGPPTHDPAAQVVAWRDGRPVGAALGRVFSDGFGWVSQLAVDRAEQRRGLGRALLLAALRHRAAAGAPRLGLGVAAGNAQALGLYLGVGLAVDREWVFLRRDAAGGPVEPSS